MFSTESSRVAVIYVRVRVFERMEQISSQELNRVNSVHYTSDVFQRRGVLFKPEYYFRGDQCLNAKKTPTVGFTVVQKKHAVT